MNTAKPFWQSKTLWINAIAALALFSSTQLGVTLSPDAQVYVLAGVNALLRLISKGEVTIS